MKVTVIDESDLFNVPDPKPESPSAETATVDKPIPKFRDESKVKRKNNTGLIIVLVVIAIIISTLIYLYASQKKSQAG